MMSEENKKTIEVYKRNAKTYIQTGIKHDNNKPNEARIKKESLQNFIKANIRKLSQRC